MSGDYMSNRMLHCNINDDRKSKGKDLLVFMNADEFHKALEDLENK